MNEELFEWDDANFSHVAAHKVSPEEAEQAILGDPIDAGFEVVDGEERWAYVGETDQGRILRVVITIRDERIRVVTAFEAPRYWKLFYLEQKRGLQ